MDSIIQWLSERCERKQLTEKWLLAGTMGIAQQWIQRVNLSGRATINIHPKTIRTIVVSLAERQLSQQSLTFATTPSSRYLVQSVVRGLFDAGQLEYFRVSDSIDGLGDRLAASIQDLRLANVGPESITEQEIECESKAADIRRIYLEYCQQLTQQRLVDYAGCLDLVVGGLSDGSLELPPELMIVMPEMPVCSSAEKQLIQTFANAAMLSHPKRLDPFSEISEPVDDRITSGQHQFAFFTGYGEVNEVRGVFETILSGHTDAIRRMDEVEILHTASEPYTSLIFELLTGWMAEAGEVDAKPPGIDALPATFAEGIPCVYSRPGRALRGWLRWARHDFVQTRAVQLIREGLLVRPPGDHKVGYSRLADTLRGIPIGFGRSRYLKILREEITSAETSLQEFRDHGDLDSGQGVRDAPDRDFGLSSLRDVLRLVSPLVELIPLPDDKPVEVLRKARQFLSEVVRSDNPFDRQARGKLLDQIDGMSENVKLGPVLGLNLLAWLEQLPIESSVMASGPRPGKVHIAPVSQGGYSGRKCVFVIGLDDGRYPKRVGVDPILLDIERERLSSNLKTSREISVEVGRSLERALFRISDRAGCEIHLSYSARDLVQDRDRFPSAALLELYRVSTGNADAQLEDFLTQLGPPTAFVNERADRVLSDSERELATLLTERSESQRRRWLEDNIDYVGFQTLAAQSRESAAFTEYDGLVPAAGNKLDATQADMVSPSRLETFGACPRRFLFRYGLGVFPPDEWIVDRQRWLDPLQFGNLVHGLFERFLAELTQQDQTPNLQRDREPLLDRLEALIEQLKRRVPVPNEDAYRRTHDLLVGTCEVFLHSEEEYCRTNNARPWVMEASLGLPAESRWEIDCESPIPLSLSDGRLIRVGGRVDRVDRLSVHGSERYAIWDYKSGSSYGFDRDDPFRQGRKLQPYLYMGMLRHRLEALGSSDDPVATFGYFFPSPKTEGLRMQWTRAELRGGDAVLRDICDLISRGLFPPTTDPSDCDYCEYRSVCGDPNEVAERSLRKCSHHDNTMLKPYQHLRGIMVEPEDHA